MSDSSGKTFYTSFVPFAFGFLQFLWSLPSYRKFSLSSWSSRYLDDVLLVVPSLEDLLVARYTLIFILQHLGFLVNIKKSYLKPTLTLEFLGKIVDFGETTLSFPGEKVFKMQNQCQEILEKEKVTVRELSKFIGKLSFTAIGVLAATLHFCHVQHQQIQN